ncbi:MraY family glycosyltransferase [Alicyclobacillus sp. SO9]|uniref:MraY family glycosyltransferase n=1 Tax=Alicyclobacillus sp. SO9 TaxID=2665646 RepID=UPI0018E7E3C4|nr:MraY family glycosyltransferase [Alicyclobacillus sp. SO9]QQE79966.1 undecaprenyl/decaprenyl-phosphate alpha-N-acetylglucosaminyl 1-phosphate transferase [Alicyclobacillus sp. SO9]
MHPAWYYMISFSVAFLIVFLMVPSIRKIALRIGFVDKPNQRKTHTEPVPLLGGIGIYISFVITAGLFGKAGKTFWGIALGGLLILAIGALDDFYKTKSRDFKPWPRFLTQILAALILVGCNITINGINDPFSGHYYTFPLWLSILTTVIWTVGITNMINFLDGIDGLAAGISAISAMSLFFIALLKEQYPMAVLSLVLMGSALGFLRHNFYPARIFMGDAGATFLGFVLAAIAVEGAFKSATLISVIVPVLALGVPIADTVWVITKRFRENRPIYLGDRGHTFHILMRFGLTQIQTVAIFYVVGLFFSIASIAVLLVAK